MDDEGKIKPCGLLGWCPLYDEKRLFAEAQALLINANIPRAQTYILLGVAIKKWCKRHAALDIAPDLVICRTAIEEAMLSYNNAPEDKKMAFYISALYRAMGENEHKTINHLGSFTPAAF